MDPRRCRRSTSQSRCSTGACTGTIGLRRPEPGCDGYSALYFGNDAVSEVNLKALITEKRQAILEIAAKHGATRVRLIGSVARGEARPDSDIDLLVKWRDDT